MYIHEGCVYWREDVRDEIMCIYVVGCMRMKCQAEVSHMLYVLKRKPFSGYFGG